MRQLVVRSWAAWMQKPAPSGYRALRGTLGIAGAGKELLGAPHERLAAHAIQVDVFIRRSACT